MAGSKSNYFENLVLDYLAGDGTDPRSATLYFALWTATLSDTSTGATAGECNYTGYARVAVTNNLTNFADASGGVKNNATVITFGQNTATNNTVIAGAILDSATIGAGNILWWGDITSTAINVGDTPKFNINGVTITED